MQIAELVLKNFGKFTDRRLTFTEGINLVYGENEAGKSTIHTFIRGMLFGMERGRGRAAAGDTFSRYEPWENGNYYAGTIRFTCGERSFCLERNFDKYTKKAVLYCEDDGEELSVEHGDLEMLLEGMKESDYENTIAAGQMKIAAGAPLAAEIQNYAANYYATGGGEVDLNGAVNALRERKKQLEREVRELSRKKQERRDQIEVETSYIWRDLRHLEMETEQTEAAWKEAQEAWRIQAEKHKKEAEADGSGFRGWRIHPVELLSMLAAFVLSFILFGRPWNFLVAVVVALAEGLYVWNCLKDGKKKRAETVQEADERLRKLAETQDREKWKLDKLREEYREKKTQYDNLTEQMNELDEMGEEFQIQEKKRRALELAEETMLELAGRMQNRLGEELNQRISSILSEVTDGKYQKVWVDEKLYMHLVFGEKRISMDQVSKGTLEQIYFALRMAAAEVLYEEEYPVILDDTFAYYDDRRLEAVLRWLKENRRQVLIFTCQNREKECMIKNQIPFHEIRL